MELELLSFVALCGISTAVVTIAPQTAVQIQRVLLEATGEEAPPAIDLQTSLMIPVMASGSLLFLYFAFSYIQYFLVLYFAFSSFCATSLCLYDPMQRAFNSCHGRKVALTATFAAAGAVVLLWLMTSHWLVVNIIGVCFTITAVAILKLPSLKVATAVLSGLFVYDIFWVFFSKYLFAKNVMVEVATSQPVNPVQVIAASINLPVVRSAALALDLPIKVLIPAGGGSFHMLGLGDMVVPGLVVAFAFRLDQFLKEQQLHAVTSHQALQQDVEMQNTRISGVLDPCSEVGSETTMALLQEPRMRPPPPGYFRAARVGYICGIVMSAVASRVFEAAQPALLYLVPMVLLPLLARARHYGQMGLVWEGFEQNSDQTHRLHS